MEEIGLRLRQKRLELKLSIEDVNLRTRIPVKFIGALEEADYSHFSAEVYYTGSLRKYARFLGIDENELMALYRAHIQKSKDLLSPQKKKSYFERPAARAVSILFVGAVVLGIAGIVIIRHLDQPRLVPAATEINPPAQTSVMTAEPQSSAQARSPVTSSASVRESMPAVVSESVSSSTVEAPPANKEFSAPKAAQRKINNGKGLALEVKCTRDSWLRIAADNKKVFEGILRAGVTRNWTADDRYDIITGYAPGVEMRLNGRRVDVRRGAIKDVNQLTLTRESR